MSKTCDCMYVCVCVCVCVCLCVCVYLSCNECSHEKFPFTTSDNSIEFPERALYS